MKCSDFLYSNQIRTIPESSKDEYHSIHEILMEIEPAEGSSLYNCLPKEFISQKLIYSYVHTNPVLETLFPPESSDKSDDKSETRYMILRERDREFVLLFVNSKEDEMHFLKIPKKEILLIFKNARHPMPF